jgi:riboflavin transporter FmnP
MASSEVYTLLPGVMTGPRGVLTDFPGIPLQRNAILPGGPTQLIGTPRNVLICGVVVYASTVAGTLTFQNSTAAVALVLALPATPATSLVFSPLNILVQNGLFEVVATTTVSYILIHRTI